MEIIDALTSAGLMVILEEENIRVKPKDLEAKPDPSIVWPLIEELKARKQEAIAYLFTQTVVCSWLETSVPTSECNKPCYRFDPGEVKECKHLLAWWKERLKWLKNNPLPPQERQAQPLSDPDCFDPDGALASLLECARKKGISDAQVASIVDDLIRAKSLKAPWGIKIKNSPILGDYWVVSDDQAKKLIPEHEAAFTAEDIGLLVEVREIFGIQNIEVKRNEQQ